MTSINYKAYKGDYTDIRTTVGKKIKHLLKPQHYDALIKYCKMFSEITKDIEYYHTLYSYGNIRIGHTFFLHFPKTRSLNCIMHSVDMSVVSEFDTHVAKETANISLLSMVSKIVGNDTRSDRIYLVLFGLTKTHEATLKKQQFKLVKYNKKDQSYIYLFEY